MEFDKQHVIVKLSQSFEELLVEGYVASGVWFESNVLCESLKGVHL